MTVAAVALMLAAIGQAQRPATSLEGAWKVVELQPAGGPLNSAPQPGLYLFTKTHFSFMRVNGTTPRLKNAPVAPGQRQSDAEKIAQYEEWQPFTALSGTYEIQGASIRTHVLVTKAEGAIGGSAVNEFTTDGKTLTLTSVSGSGYAQPAGSRVKLTRVE